MKIVVGLGNPGRKYEGTRHNVGFVVVREVARRHGAPKPRVNFQGEVTEVEIAGQRVVLLWPQTFMNRSGGSVLAARDFYKLESQEVLIVCDDFNLPLGKLRCRPEGSAGGQKGLADVIDRLGSLAVPRLRMGVGPVPPNWDPADFVLARYSTAEHAMMEAIWPRAADAVEMWIIHGIEQCMNTFNSAATPSD